MNERLVELIIAIIDRLIDRRADVGSVENLTNTLVADGYTVGEINNAFMWLYQAADESLFETSGAVPHSGPKSTLRMLNEFERTLFTTQAYGYILQLSQLGLLDDLQIEELIERAMYTCAEMVEINDIKRIVPSIILEHMPGFHPRLFSWRSGEMDGTLAH
jgi:uncharacterized protein Smg (DUF494 family)